MLDFHSLMSSFFLQFTPSGDVPACYAVPCKYGPQCYRRNPTHKSEYYHIKNGAPCLFLQVTSGSFAMQHVNAFLRSVFDCRQRTFSLFSGPLSENAFNLRSFDLKPSANGDLPVHSVRVHFAAISTWKEIKRCRDCQRTIWSPNDHYFSCQTCPSFVLCQQCESLVSEESTHDASHIFSKIYPRNQPNVQPSPSLEVKLDSIILSLEKMKIDQLAPAPAIQQEKSSSVDDEEEDDEQPFLERRRALLDLQSMGFPLNLRTCNLVVQFDGDLPQILDSLCD